VPSANDVSPKRWSDKIVLFDDGEYSVISGIYDGQPRRVLGERWNQDQGSLGFPNVLGHAVWHVVPQFLELPVLHGLLDEMASVPGQPAERTSAILSEISLRRQAVDF
jgi:hypothetical protein